MEFTPSAPAGVDDQGNANTCSLFALSKAVCNGFETKKFVPGYLDFNQETTRNILMNKVQGSTVLNSRFPTDFDGIIFTIQDKKNEYYSTTIGVNDISVGDFGSDRSTNDRFEHLIVTNLGNGPHCLYVDSHDPVRNKITCINSHGQNNPNPVVSMKNVVRYYRASALANKLLIPTSVRQSIAPITTSTAVQNPPTVSKSTSSISAQNEQ